MTVQLLFWDDAFSLMNVATANTVYNIFKSLFTFVLVTSGFHCFLMVNIVVHAAVFPMEKNN